VKSILLQTVCLALVSSIGSVMSYPIAAESAEKPKPPGVVLEEFIYEKASFPSCHASTIAETPGGLAAAWFGGTDEGERDVGIWLSRRTGDSWSAPAEVASGVESPEKRYPCWNPVLFQAPKGPLLLFYKVGPSPSSWWGMLETSPDSGATWTKARRLPEGILGPVKDKPLLLPGGDLLCPSSTEHAGWKIHFERTPDLGATWTKTDPVGDGKAFAAIQPTILTHPGGRLQALCRTRRGKIAETWSSDGGKTWSALEATALPNPNAGIDGVTLSDGRHLLVYNHTVSGGPSPRGREMLNVAMSTDGAAWRAAVVLENEKGEFSYPAVIQATDGKVHITYTWQRKRIKHAVLDPGKLELRDMPEGRWPR
jgi:predicted neuraminidase